MSTRVVEGKKPYTGGEAIDINEDKVISLKLRDENNLIIYDEGDDEIYVDLQLSNEIEPTDAFPVGVNTGRVIVDNGWDKTGTLISAKTTSGDNIQLLYADDGTLWIDNGTGTFKQIYFKGDVDDIVATLTEYIDAHDTVVSDTAPSDPYEGELWYDTVNDTLKVYNGNTWVATGGGGGGSGDVVGPSSATDGHLAVFDGATGKLIKDGGPVPTGGAEIEYKTQAEYNALLPGALTDNKHYFIYTSDTPTPPTPWQPGANTVVYYPLTEDILDHSGNSYNLTAYGGSNYSFTTNSQGLACINLNPGNTKTYFKSTPTIDFSTSDYTFVCKICDILTSYTSSRAGAAVFSLASNFKGPVVSMGDEDPAANLGTTAGRRELPSGGTAEGPQTKIPLTGSDFVTCICVRDHTALTLTSYFDGVYNWKCTYNSAPSSYQTLTLFRDVYDGGSGRFLHGKMRDVIVEDKAWTLQEIQNFSS